MAINEELLYEVNEQGERILVRSTESNQRAFLRFYNLTKRPVDLWWRDFNGIRRHYGRLKPDTAKIIDTYISHPWEFSDAATKERYCILNSYIFRAPRNMGNMKYRVNFNITICVRTLRDTALLAVALKIPRPEVVSALELPRGLQAELQELVQKINEEEAQV